MSDTEQIRAGDERFEACLRLASQMHALSGLYQGVVHDLKSPLNTLAVHLELLRSTFDPGGPEAEKQERYARVLHEELMRLNRSIESLLPATAQVRGEPRRFCLRELTGEVAAFIGPQARRQKVTVTTRLGDEGGPPLMVDAHRDRLKQALLAVAVNGLEAMPEGGELAIELRLRNGAGQPRGRVVVTDTGPGVPDGDRDRIYDLYFSTKPGHWGIGLYVAHQVVKSTNGTIELSSTPERGSRFELSFPLRR
ncbi:MAG: HAMP domain-containing sensor histidine kinase [Acidobacteriota bacterium]|jgi:signal transduction histidine kinase